MANGDRDEARIYIVDDEEVMRDSLRMAFETAGVVCRCYRTADEFLKQFSRSQRGCLIVDLRLPGTSGLELVERVATQSSGLATVLMTGHGDQETETRAREAGVVAVFEKPFPFDEMLACVQKVIAKG